MVPIFLWFLRGFHVYSNIWKPKLNQKINIASIVGHIPKEISLYTRYTVEHGAFVDAFVHHRSSPLIQGGLEIPIKLVVKLTDNEVNSAKLKKYRNFVDKNYREPVDGKFADNTEGMLKLIGAQNAGLGEDDDDEDIEHESDQ